MYYIIYIDGFLSCLLRGMIFNDVIKVNIFVLKKFFVLFLYYKNSIFFELNVKLQEEHASNKCYLLIN